MRYQVLWYNEDTMPYHLYIKTHKTSGKKYFGFTKNDPFSYKGSGYDWLPHLREFGNDVETEVFGTFEDKATCAKAARKFSEENDIAKSNLWLNRISETLGGGTSNGVKCRKTMFEKYGKDYYRRIASFGREQMPEEQKEILRQHPKCIAGGKANQGKVRLKVICPHCKKEGANNVMSRWHFNNCKNMAM